MKKACWIRCILLLFLLTALLGCSQKAEKEGSEKEAAYTVVDPDEVPEELKQIIEENKENEMKMSYLADQVLYAVRGYGQQKTGGYSIQVNGVWDTGEEIHVDTSLIGPSPDREMKEEPSYPCLVLNLGKTEKQVVFD